MVCRGVKMGHQIKEFEFKYYVLVLKESWKGAYLSTDQKMNNEGTLVVKIH